MKARKGNPPADIGLFGFKANAESRAKFDEGIERFPGNVEGDKGAEVVEVANQRYVEY